MSDTSLVTTGKPKVGGAVSIAPVGTTLPTSANDVLASGFTSLGYISEDGMSNEFTPESETIKAWGGDIVLTPMTDREDTFSFTLIESLNVDVLKVVYGGDNVSGTLATGITIKANTQELSNYSWVVDMTGTDNTVNRIVIPKAKVTDLGEITYTDDEAVGYEVTITAVPDSEGVCHYNYILGNSATE